MNELQSVPTQPSKRFPATYKRINMQSTIALSLFIMAASVCQCQLTAFHPFISAASANFAPVPVATTWASPSLFSMSQYHAQDELGQASYGYAYPGQAAANFRDAWGNQVGSWAYFDPEGKEVRVSYVADSRGFRVLSNNLPVAPMSVHSSPALVAPVQVADTPEVEEAKRAHFAAVAEAKARNAAAVAAAAGSSRRRRSPGRYYSTAKAVAHHHVQPTYYSYQKAAVPVVHVAPVEPIAAPVVQQTVHAFPTFPTVHAVPVAPAIHAEVHALPVAAPVVVQQIAPVQSPIISKFHSQDELGQAAFGHVTADQSASNFRDASGNQMGHYAYINPDGQQIVVYYTAGAGGFRVISNALPEAPVQFQHAAPIAPAIVQDTPEVAQARREHLALVEEARNRIRSSP